MSAWWEEEARQYAGQFAAHDDRYDRVEEYMDVLKGLWTEDTFSYDGKYYHMSIRGRHSLMNKNGMAHGSRPILLLLYNNLSQS